MGRRITKLKITELSGCDRPANNLCLVDSMEIVKRADAPDIDAQDMGMLRKAFARVFNVKEDALADILKVAERDDVDPKEGKKKYGNVKFADEKNKKYPLDTKEHVQAALSYIGMPKNRKKYSAEDLKTIEGKIHAAAKKFGIDAEKADLPEDVLKAYEADPSILLCDSAEDIEKGLYTVACVAQLLQQLHYTYQELCYEREQEGDDSKVPEMVESARDQLSEALVAMTQEETSELTEKAMSLAVEAERLMKDYAAGTGIFVALKKADPAPADKPAEKPVAVVIKMTDVETLVKVLNEQGEKCVLVKGADEAELEALAQGAHDAMAAAGAPPHVESEGGDDVSEGKADAAIDLVKNATGLPEDDRAVMLTLMKRGAKFSKAVGEKLQKAHDLIGKIGAKCDMGKAATQGDMQKMLDAAVNKAVSAVVNVKDAQIEALNKRLQELESRPAALPAGPNGQPLQFRVVEKDGSTTAYVAPGSDKVNKAVGTEPENITAPNGTKVSKIVQDANELLPGIHKIHEDGGQPGIEGLMTH